MLIMDPDGKERWRLEGYLPRAEFRANIEMGLARVAFMKKDWAGAEQRYADVVERYPDSHYAPDAIYWRGISRYKQTSDHDTLTEVADAFTNKYQNSLPAVKSTPWRH